MNPSTPRAGSSVFVAIYAANQAMSRSEKTLEADADDVALNGASVENMVDLAIQPELFAASARVVKSADEMARSTFNVLA